MNTDEIATPRTDAFYKGEKISDDEIFARTLERELVAAKSALKVARQALQQSKCGRCNGLEWIANGIGEPMIRCHVCKQRAAALSTLDSLKP